MILFITTRSLYLISVLKYILVRPVYWFNNKPEYGAGDLVTEIIDLNACLRVFNDVVRKVMT